MSKDDLKSKKSTNLNIRPRRVFSTKFKRQKVAELLVKFLSPILVNCGILVQTRFTVGFTNILQNIKKRGRPCDSTMVIQLDSEATKTQELLQRISELERTLGQKQMVIDFNEKLIEISRCANLLMCQSLRRTDADYQHFTQKII